MVVTADIRERRTGARGEPDPPVRVAELEQRMRDREEELEGARRAVRDLTRQLNANRHPGTP